MAKQTKLYAYKAILSARTSGKDPSVIDDLNDWGGKGYRFVGTYTLPATDGVVASEYLLMEKETEAATT